MIPKDPVIERNEAFDLWKTKGIDPISFYEKLDFPNPQESAERLYMWENAPELLFPEVAKKIQAIEAEKAQAALAASGGVPPEGGGGEVLPPEAVAPEVAGGALPPELKGQIGPGLEALLAGTQ